MTDQQLYNSLYEEYREAGDDPMNARLRVIEAGASEEMSLEAQESAGETDDSDDDDVNE